MKFFHISRVRNTSLFCLIILLSFLSTTHVYAADTSVSPINDFNPTISASSAATLIPTVTDTPSPVPPPVFSPQLSPMLFIIPGIVLFLAIIF